MNFRIEKRGGWDILVGNGWCRPASKEETELYAALATTQACPICGGTGDPSTDGRNCACGGSGKWYDCYLTMQKELAAEQERVKELEAEIKCMKEHTWCAYCGLEIHIDDEAATKISEHIVSCEKHPIHIALSDNTVLRKRCEEAEKKCGSCGLAISHKWMFNPCEAGHQFIWASSTGTSVHPPEGTVCQCGKATADGQGGIKEAKP